jgi:hypothetical protein
MKVALGACLLYGVAAREKMVERMWLYGTGERE